MTEIAQVVIPPVVQEIEVSAKKQRRHFSAKEKQRILEKADEACAARTGELGALLRREGIYSSTLATWREARRRGELDGLAPKKRGPVAKQLSPAEKEVIELKRAVAKSEARFKRAEAMIEIQKKVSELLGIQLPENDEVP